MTTQVIERHIIRGLENIFNPIIVGKLKDAEVEAIASEPEGAKRQRAILEDKVKKLQDGRKILKGVVGSG